MSDAVTAYSSAHFSADAGLRLLTPVMPPTERIVMVARSEVAGGPGVIALGSKAIYLWDRDTDHTAVVPWREVAEIDVDAGTMTTADGDRISVQASSQMLSECVAGVRGHSVDPSELRIVAFGGVDESLEAATSPALDPRASGGQEMESPVPGRPVDSGTAPAGPGTEPAGGDRAGRDVSLLPPPPKLVDLNELEHTEQQTELVPRIRAVPDLEQGPPPDWLSRAAAPLRIELGDDPQESIDLANFEIARQRQVLVELGAADAADLRREAAQLRAELEARRSELTTLRNLVRSESEAHEQSLVARRAELAELERGVAAAEECEWRQEPGRALFPDGIETHPELAERLKTVRTKKSRIKKNGRIIVDGDEDLPTATQLGNQAAVEIAELLATVYNAEHRAILRTMTGDGLDDASRRLRRAQSTIAAAFTGSSFKVAPRYHKLCVAELKIRAEYLSQVR